MIVVRANGLNEHSLVRVRARVHVSNAPGRHCVGKRAEICREVATKNCQVAAIAVIV